MKFIKTVCMAAVVGGAMFATQVSAATVSSGVTTIGDGGGIDLAGPDTAVASALFGGVANLPGSDWVWGLGGVGSSALFEFSFDMTGFDLSTAELAGNIVVDNEAVISLNGTVIASFLGAVVDHFQQVNAYGTTDGSLFNAGANLLTFAVNDLGGGRGLRANVEVTADAAGPVSTVPLPAGGALLLTALGALAWRRKRAA